MTRSSTAVLLTLGSLVAGYATSVAGQGPANEQAIRDVIQAHATAWNGRDAVAAAAVYAPDAVVRTSSGRLLKGRAAIEQAHREWLAEDTAGADLSTSIHPSRLRFNSLGRSLPSPMSMAVLPRDKASPVHRQHPTARRSSLLWSSVVATGRSLSSAP